MDRLRRLLVLALRLLPVILLVSCGIEEDPPMLPPQDEHVNPMMGLYQVSLTLEGGTGESGLFMTVTSTNESGTAQLYDDIGNKAVGVFLDEKSLLYRRLTVEEEPIGTCYYQLSTGKDAIGLDVYLRLTGAPKVPVNVSWVIHKDGFLLGSGQKMLPDGNSNLTLCASQMLGLE